MQQVLLKYQIHMYAVFMPHLTEPDRALCDVLSVPITFGPDAGAFTLMLPNALFPPYSRSL